MANTSAPFGLKHIGVSDGVPPTFGLSQGLVASTNTTKIFKQDPMKKLSTGYLAQWTAGTAVSQLAGTFVSCKYFSTSQQKILNSPYWPGADATGDVTVYYIPATGSVPPKYVVQNSSSTTAITFADVGQNADVALGTGSTSGGGFSGATLDQTTLATTATLPFRIVGLYSDIAPVDPNGIDNTTGYNWVIVQANTVGAGATGI